MLRLTKRYSFAASHRLHIDEWSDDQNRETFGKCNYPYGHGHNYVVEVRVAGPADPETGMVVRRDRLDAFVKRAVLERVEHRDLNSDVPEFENLNPTTENLAIVVSKWLCEAWPAEFREAGLELGIVRVEETAKNSFQVVP